VFPLERALVEALEWLPLASFQARPEVQLAVKALLEDPKAQELMARLAELELQDPGVAEARAQASALVEAEAQVEVLEPVQVEEQE
jgi:hypothetical protein